MTSKKLGSLLRSVPPATAVETRDPAPVPIEGPVPAEPRASRSVRPVSEPEVPLQVLIPANIRKELAVKAAEEGQSLRALMLTAIRSLGIKVTDADIKGKRGRRFS